MKNNPEVYGLEFTHSRFEMISLPKGRLFVFHQKNSRKPFVKRAGGWGTVKRDFSYFLFYLRF